MPTEDFELGTFARRRQANCGSGIGKLGPCFFLLLLPTSPRRLRQTRFDDILFFSCLAHLSHRLHCCAHRFLSLHNSPSTTLLPIHSSHVILCQDNALQPTAFTVAGCDKSSPSHLCDYPHQEPDPLATKGGLQRAGHAHRTLLRGHPQHAAAHPRREARGARQLCQGRPGGGGPQGASQAWSQAQGKD